MTVCFVQAYIRPFLKVNFRFCVLLINMHCMQLCSLRVCNELVIFAHDLPQDGRNKHVIELRNLHCRTFFADDTKKTAIRGINVVATKHQRYKVEEERRPTLYITLAVLLNKRTIGRSDKQASSPPVHVVNI